MCTIVALLEVHPRFPVILAANRDERYVRPSSGPVRMETQQVALAGRDLDHGGTWFGVNALGLAVAIADQGTATTPTPKRSRGLLVLDALARGNAHEVESLLAQLDHSQYNPCTLLYADGRTARLSSVAGPPQAARELVAGLHVMVSGIGAEHARAREQRVLAAMAPEELSALDVATLRQTLVLLLRGHDSTPGADDALCRHREQAGTVSSFIALLAGDPAASQFWCAVGAPCATEYVDYTSLLPSRMPLRH